jgi:hypothetical protein
MATKATSPQRAVELQKKAKKQVFAIIRKTPFGLGDLDQDNFTFSMDRITNALFEAWTRGYEEGVKRS